MDWPSVVLTIAGATLLAWLWREWRKPGVLVTVQKVVNANNQPETVTVQTNLRGMDPRRLWWLIEQAALAATARSTTVNQDILDYMKAESEEIMRKRVEKLGPMRAELNDYQRGKIAKQLGCKSEEVDGLLAKYRKAPEEAAG